MVGIGILTGVTSDAASRSFVNGGLIVTLTANPAIDRTICVDRLAFDDRAYIRSSGESAGRTRD